jgi:hypothetical protein
MPRIVLANGKDLTFSWQPAWALHEARKDFRPFRLLSFECPNLVLGKACFSSDCDGFVDYLIDLMGIMTLAAPNLFLSFNL